MQPPFFRSPCIARKLRIGRWAEKGPLVKNIDKTVAKPYSVQIMHDLADICSIILKQSTTIQTDIWTSLVPEVAMLVHFSVSNFRSIRDRAEISMVASNSNSMEEHTFYDIYRKHKLLKSAAIFGANASGKSNVLKSILALKSLVCNSHNNQPAQLINAIVPFKLNIAMEHAPSEFEIVLILDDTIYTYGVVIDRKVVHREYLKSCNLNQTKLTFKRQFDRLRRPDGGYDVKLGKSWMRPITHVCLENQLLLSKYSQNGHQMAGDLYKWFSAIEYISNTIDPQRTIAILSKNATVKKFVTDLVKQADPGFAGSVETVKPIEESEVFEVIRNTPLFNESNVQSMLVYQIAVSHQIPGNSRSVDFSFEEDESEGTKRLYSMSGPIFNAMRNGSLVLCDELDSSLHPLLAEEILNAINSEANASSQVIFTTHNTNLLRHLRRDQVWFIERNPNLKTSLYSLHDYLPTSRTDIAKSYLTGRYGAIPIIDDLSDLVSQLKLESVE